MARILVIDDTKDHLAMLKLVLQLQHHDVATAPDKETAIPLLNSFAPEIILLDVFLKDGISGRELCKAIKKTHPHIPIILISANQQSLEDYKLCNADAVIEKPFEISTVFETINRLLKR